MRWTTLLLVLLAAPAAKAAVMFGVAPFDNTLDSNLYRIDESTGAATLIGDTGFTDMGGLAFNAANVLYGYTPGALYTIDTTTGAATRMGLLGSNHPEGGLAFQPGTGVLFAVKSVLADELVTINTSTGASTTVGLLGSAGRDTSGLAFAADGTLFGVALGPSPDQLIRIDTITGAATAIGPLGTNVLTPTVGGLEIDPDSGILYYSDNQNLYSVNKTTGAATLIGAHGVSGMAGLAAGNPGVPEPATLVPAASVSLMLLRRRRR
jgi:DNA-binding beta-propeller fold protein YncE